MPTIRPAATLGSNAQRSGQAVAPTATVPPDPKGPDALTLTRELVGRPSVTPDDGGCQELLIAELAPLGFEVERLPFADVTNFWARRGSAGPLLAFAGHTDVVPPGPLDAWSSPPFVPSIRGDALYGRGAADMKASLAAMLVATRRFVGAQPDHAGSIALLVTSDEEGDAVNGTTRVMDHLRAQGTTIDWCVVGEPSSRDRLGDVVRVGRRGSLNARLTVHGVQGHVAYPEEASNPIHSALGALDALARRTWDAGNDFFPPTGFQISNIAAGTGAANVIPGTLTVHCNFRFNTEQTVDALRAEVERTLAAAAIRFEIEWSLSGLPFLTRPGALTRAVRAAVRDVAGLVPESSTGGGTSDGRFIAPTGTEVVELGPVNATIHKVDEHVAIADIDALARMYEGVMRTLLVPD